MDRKVRVIKRENREEPGTNRLEQPRDTTRETTITIKQWISEFKEGRRKTNISNPRSGWPFWGQQSET